MAERKTAKKARTAASGGRPARTETFTSEERAAMRERAREVKAARGGSRGGEGEVLAKIAEMPEPDRSMARRVHEIVTAAAPGLSPRTWYGMPAYARDDGKVVCHFQGRSKFKTRYATLGFSERAHLDDGNMWPTGFAVAKLGAGEEARIRELVERAVG